MEKREKTTTVIKNTKKIRDITVIMNLVDVNFIRLSLGSHDTR